MASEAATIAEKLQGRIWQLSNFFAWGGALVRPGDETFQVLAVEARGDRLDLELSEGNDPTKKGETLSVFGPSGFKLTANGFEIRKASRIRWGSREFGPAKGTKEPALNVE